ncbi:immunoglobulin kappa light chain-like isoform X2 [Xyrichtys novacula]|nr:immunoglobulin kappa light chain-like isoform X2 [Xyrichtys novacula]
MMTSLKFVLYVTCLILGEIYTATGLNLTSSAFQESGFVSVQTGGTLILKCFYEGQVAARLYWYKHALGQKPRLISTFYTLETKGIFHGTFKESQRFSLDAHHGENHLTITHMHVFDSATYHCISSYLSTLEILESTTVNVKGSGLNVSAIIHQAGSETIQLGGSATLNCTVQTGTCDGEHSVYWFKNSEESHQGLLYTSGGKENQCEREPNSQTQTCVYNLSIKHLNNSHFGTYYCAVASCGHILFGNGTKLDFEDKIDPFVLVYILSGALTITTILVVFLSFTIYKKIKSNPCQCTEAQPRFSAPAAADSQGRRDNLHYAALSVHQPKRPGRQRSDRNTDCVYSSVKL